MNNQDITSQRAHSQRGQTFLIIVVFIGVFLLAVMGLGTDYAQIWAHRQIAQGAADAACQAGAADLLLYFEDSTSTYSTANAAWITSGGYDCSTHTSSSPCKYAAQNGGYTGSNVSVTFPSSLPNAPAIPAGYGTIAHPYIQVSITDAVPIFFTKLVSSTHTVSVTTKAGCGIVTVNAAIPLVVLSPTASGALSLGGSSGIAIYGGPQRSIQVNSHAAGALSGGASIDLSAAGPSYTGGDIGVFGGPTTNPGVLGTASPYTGHYISPSAPISDPFVDLPEVPTPSAGTPIQPAKGTPGTAYGTDGCPDSGGCVLFVPGYYKNGIEVGPGSKTVAIFDPGVYFVNGGITLDSNSVVRPSAANSTTAPYGTIFYLTGCTTCISVAANSGSKSTTNNFSASTLSSGGNCIAYVAPPGVTPPTQGNMLMAPCTGTYGDPAGAGNRGILFFVDRSISAASAGWGGGGQFIMAGAFYVHNSSSSNDTFTLGGNSGSGSLVIGNMIVDTLSMSGTPNITMQLNPASSYPILEVELLE